MYKFSKNCLILLAIVGIAAFFRFYQLDRIPPGLYPDVAINGTEAIEGLKTGQFKLFYPENNGREGMMIWLDALFISLFGPGIYALKFGAALAGVLTVVGIYLLGKELFGKKGENAALLASFFLATSFWHVNFSRIGFRAILTPLCLIFAFYFFFKGFRTKKIFWQIPAGLIFGAGFYTYISFRLAVPLLIAALTGWFLYCWRGRLPVNFLRAAAMMLASVFAVALPIGLYFLGHPGDFMGRANQTSVFSASNPLLALGRSLGLHLGMFNIYGDGNWRHNFSGSPQLFWPVGIFFLIGLVLAAKRMAAHFKSRDFGIEFNSCLLMLAWLFFLLLPGILTQEGSPHALRVIGIIPPVFLLAGLGGWAAYDFIKAKWAKKTALALSLIFLAAVAGSEYYKYFVQWANNGNVFDAFTEIFYNEGKLLSSLSADSRTVVIVNESGVAVPYPDGIPVSAQTIIYMELSDCLSSNSFNDPACESPYSQFILPDRINEIKINGRTVIMPMKSDQALFEILKQQFPNGNIKAEGNIQYYDTY
jgi:4-amino-4-deoxy-L-arabinose transferase-like glycosyltransferase